jgi:hypothetical protein
MWVHATSVRPASAVLMSHVRHNLSYISPTYSTTPGKMATQLIASLYVANDELTRHIQIDLFGLIAQRLLDRTKCTWYLCILE